MSRRRIRSSPCCSRTSSPTSTRPGGSLKTFLGDPLVGRTNVFGEEQGLEALIAAILVQIRERAAALTGERPRDVTIGRPVRFVGEGDVEERALGSLRAAAELAGFRDARIALEPVAAARASGVDAGNALVFDFGGGTFDLCVAPANAIRDWHALSALNEKDILDALDDLVRAGGPKRELAALRGAIELQLGYEIFRAVDDAKCRLSSATTTVLTYHRAAVDVDARLSRFRFEQLIGPFLRRIDALLAAVCERAGVRAEAIVDVVTTGGSSKIPAVRALLARRFPGARLRDADPFGAVAAGLALL